MDRSQRCPADTNKICLAHPNRLKEWLSNHLTCIDHIHNYLDNLHVHQYLYLCIPTEHPVTKYNTTSISEYTFDQPIQSVSKYGGVFSKQD